MTYTLEKALDDLPDGSPFREILRLYSVQETAREAGALIYDSGLITPYWEANVAKPEQEARTVLRAALELTWPQPERAYDDPPAARLLFALLGSVYPSVIELIEQHFDDVDRKLRLNLLTILASGASRETARALGQLVARHGWPSKTHGRFDSELFKNVEFADEILPALLDSDAADSDLTGRFALGALQSGSVEPELVSDSRLGGGLADRIDALLDRYDSEPYETGEIVRQLAIWVDLAGWTGRADVVEPLQRVARLPENWPAAFAVGSLLRIGHEVDPKVVERIAADHAARVPFWQVLSRLGRQELIPETWRNRDAFAAANMVEWLSHPGELGRPPEDLELMKVFEAEDDDGEPIVLYVWRFLTADGQWYAATSGPYQAQDPPSGRLHGNSTFSNFEPWENATAEEHANAILGTVDEWNAAR